MDEITQPIDMMSHKQACLDLEKATQFITYALQVRYRFTHTHAHTHTHTLLHTHTLWWCTCACHTRQLIRHICMRLFSGADGRQETELATVVTFAQHTQPPI